MNFLHGLCSSLVGYGYEEGVDVIEESVDEEVEDRISETPAAVKKNPSIAQLVKNSVLAIDAGRSLDPIFDARSPEQVAARDWVQSLDECGIRALRHMPLPALARHLDQCDDFRGAGLPAYPLSAAANENAPAAAEASEMDFELVERQARP